MKRALLFGFLAVAVACGDAGNGSLGDRAFIEWTSGYLVPVQSLDSPLPEDALERCSDSNLRMVDVNRSGMTAAKEAANG